LVGASPLNDLVRIEQAEVLPKLYGEGVVPQACRIRREPISMATNTYSTRKVSVIDTKKSQATIAVAWFRMNVAQR
jgi:hypothetical protein